MLPGNSVDGALIDRLRDQDHLLTERARACPRRVLARRPPSSSPTPFLRNTYRALAKVPETIKGVDASIMAVAPVTSHCIVANRRDAKNMDIVGYGRRVQAPFVGPLINAHSARALLSEVSKWIGAHMSGPPGDSKFRFANLFNLPGYGAAAFFPCPVILNAYLCGQKFGDAPVNFGRWRQWVGDNTGYTHIGFGSSAGAQGGPPE